MRMGWVVTVVLGSMGVAFAAGRASAPKLHPQTVKNLDTAMHGEAFAFVKYELFAQHARQSGHPEVGQLFDQAARTERFEHFAEEAKLARLVGSDADNLRDAIHGESYETATMYPEFARRAAAVGDTAAADRFREIGRDEAKHRDAFGAALSRLGKARGAGGP